MYWLIGISSFLWGLMTYEMAELFEGGAQRGYGSFDRALGMIGPPAVALILSIGAPLLLNAITRRWVANTAATIMLLAWFPYIFVILMLAAI